MPGRLVMELLRCLGALNLGCIRVSAPRGPRCWGAEVLLRGDAQVHGCPHSWAPCCFGVLVSWCLGADMSICSGTCGSRCYGSDVSGCLGARPWAPCFWGARMCGCFVATLHTCLGAAMLDAQAPQSSNN